MPLICLFGPDGSGKSTLARLLVGVLEGCGFKVRVSWMRGTHTFASILARFLSYFSIFRGFDNPYYGISIPRCLMRLWQLVEFISILPILFIKFLLPSILGYVVVAERFLPDFLVWVSLTTRDEYYLNCLEARFLLALSAKMNMKFYVTASKVRLMERRGGEVDAEFLDGQLKLYGRMAKLLKAYKIDTTESSVEESLSQLLALISIKV